MVKKAWSGPLQSRVLEASKFGNNFVSQKPDGVLSPITCRVSMRATGERLLELDGLRGIAFFSVFAFHLAPYLRPHISGRGAEIILGAFDLGWAGVDLFFVLSGFLITSILIKTKNGPRYFRNFYARRILRIFPLYYIFIVGMTPAIHSPAWYWLYIQNWLQATDAAFSLGPVAHLWSLAVEEQFYLIWPLLVWSLSRRWLVITLFFLIVGAPVLRMMAEPLGQQFLYFSTVTRLDCLAMGASIAVIPIDDSRSRTCALVLGLISVLALAPLAHNGPHRFWGNTPMATIGLTFTALGSVSLLLWGLSGSMLLRASLLRGVGRYSYGLYIFHYPVLFFCDYLLHLIPARGIAFVFLFTSLAGGLTFCLAYISWHLMEKRFLAFKTNFSSSVCAGSQDKFDPYEKAQYSP